MADTPGNDSTIELKGTISKKAPPAPAANADPYTTIELKVTINKNKPATPGDKSTGQIIDTAETITPETKIWTLKQDVPKSPLRIDNIEYCEDIKIQEYLTGWDGREIITVSKRHQPPDDIVITAGLPDLPRWLAKVSVRDDGIPPAKTAEEKKRVRVNASLSFDEDNYTIQPFKKWPQELFRQKEYVQDIFKAIQDGNEAQIKELTRQRYIDVSTSRIPVGEIHEGEWLLPVFIGTGQENKSEDTEKKNIDETKNRKFLVYVKVIIEFVSDEAKPAAK